MSYSFSLLPHLSKKLSKLQQGATDGNVQKTRKKIEKIKKINKKERRKKRIKEKKADKIERKVSKQNRSDECWQERRK